MSQTPPGDAATTEYVEAGALADRLELKREVRCKAGAVPPL